MKRWLLLIFCVAGIWGIAFCIKVMVLRQESTSSRSTRTETRSDDNLGVDELMKNIDSIHGTVRVRGVISSILPQKRMLTLIDIEEYERCKVLTCAPLTLPVEWSGPMPAVRESIEAIGEVRETGGKLIFAAKQISPVEIQEEGIE